MIFAFLERVQFNFSSKDGKNSILNKVQYLVEVNKEFVQEVLRDLNLKQNQCDPYYAKFCCFFILKIPSSAVPEGFSLNELFQMIFKALARYPSLLSDLLKNLPQAFYSLCYRGNYCYSYFLLRNKK